MTHIIQAIRKKWRGVKCKACLKEFRSSRDDAETCSPRCRQYFKRHQQPYPLYHPRRQGADVSYNPATPPLPGMEEIAGEGIALPVVTDIPAIADGEETSGSRTASTGATPIKTRRLSGTSKPKKPKRPASKQAKKTQMSKPAKSQIRDRVSVTKKKVTKRTNKPKRKK